MRTPPKGTLRETLRRLASSPEGYDTRSVKGFTHTQVASATDAMKQRGEIFAGHRTHKNVRYFSTQEAADVYAGAKPRGMEPTVKALPSNFRFRPDAKVITPPHVQIQYGPSPRSDVYRTNTHEL